MNNKEKLSEDALDIAYIKNLEKTMNEDSELYTHEEVKKILGIEDIHEVTSKGK